MELSVMLKIINRFANAQVDSLEALSSTVCHVSGEIKKKIDGFFVISYHPLN